MKVAMVQSTPLPPSEGIGVYTWSLARRLVGRGHDVTLVTRGPAQPSVAEQEEGIRIVRPAFRPVYPLHVHLHAWHTEAALRREAPDIVHLHSPLPPPVSAGRPVLATFHSLMRRSVARRRWREAGTLRARLQVPFSYHVERRAARLARAITVVSPSRLADLEGYGLPARPVHVIPSGVDLGRFPAQRLPDGPPRLLCVGRLAPAKGLPDLIEAMREVGARHPGARLHIVGDGPLADSLRARAKRIGVGDLITWHGRVPHEDLPRLHAASTLFVHPSHNEGMPTAILEAMASARAVVGCRVPGTSDVVEPGVTGSLVPAGRPAALAHAIVTLLDAPDELRRMGRAGRKKVEEEHDWDRLTDRFEAIYEQVVGGSV